MPNSVTPDDDQTTDFGYKNIPCSEKTAQVKAVFHSVAAKYDLMNDLMSLGMHRLWKQFTVALSQIQASDKILDIAGGTGDLTKAFSQRLNEEGKVILFDINTAMLQIGRDRLIDAGHIDNSYVLQGNAECLPFADDYFDCITIAFGLRNITHKMTALQSMYRVLKPGGQLLVLEFSKPVLAPLRALYDHYSFNVIPKLGQWITHDATSYHYLVESIRRHPDQENLKSLILESGFDHCDYHNLSGGIVALHRAWKF